MSNNLWELRKQRNLTVKQLAAKSGVPAKNIYAYEAGEQVKMADLEQLAKALFVNKAEIKFKSDPIPKTKPEPPQAKPARPAEPPQTRAKTPPASAPESGKKQGESPQPPQLATEGQLANLNALANRLGFEETAVVAQLGKPLDQLTFTEARQLLKTYEKDAKAQKVRQLGERPPGTRRWRASVPEGVDEFEAGYLQARQEAGDEVTFTLFDETVFTGRIIGFSPYTITIQQADGNETTLYKLALAYYQVAPGVVEEAI
jgi:transcriptional regulator with XRE-family HTH domain